MVRQLHGRYNTATGLPDNAMQPVGSGYNVWLNEQVLSIFGPIEGQRLIDESSTHGAHRYTWLCNDVLINNGYQDIVDEYHRRRLASAAQLRLRDKQRQRDLYIERLRTLPEEGNELTIKHYRKEIAKCQKYIDERTGE